MGVTKRVGELMVTHAGRVSKTAFCAVRFGNVLGSAGSAVPLFQEQIAAGGPVTITHPEVRRYFMTIGEAVGLILEAAYGGYGELCVLDMGEQLSIVELARHMITMAGYVPEIDIPIVYTGLRPGEKLSEDLFTEREEQTHRVSKKLLVATPAPPPFELESTIERLIAAAEAGDEDRSVELLAALVPSFRRRPDMSTTPDRAETEAAVGAGSSAVGLVEGGHA